MAQRNQTVTIPLEEYKELLLRDKPSEHDKEVLDKLLGILAEGLNYTDESRSYSSYYMGDHLECRECEKLVKELLTMLRYVDRELYMRVWNAVVTRHREEEAKAAMVEQMNMAREIRKEQEN